MAMTEQDFEALAGVLLRERPPAHASETAWDDWRAIVWGVADVCRDSNPRFSLIRFSLAAGLITS